MWKTITSDTIGNMLSDGTWSYTWQHGRQLAGMIKSGTGISYTYDSDGMRTGKTVNGTTTKYMYYCSQLIAMDTELGPVYFHYDGTGVMAMEIQNTMLYYVKNSQGDVVALVDASGYPVVEYSYDAWGNILSVDGLYATTYGLYNPFRYRSYVYDDDTGLYYLQSRYYSPELARFINADIYASTGEGILGYNMFAYCLNSPILYADSTGCDAMILVDESFPGHIGVIVQDENEKWWHFYWGTDGIWLRCKCFIGIDVEPYSWCAEYSDDLSLDSINQSGQYSHIYEEMYYLMGDFSSCVDMFKSPKGKYNLYNQNCSQVSLSTLATAHTEYSHILSNASKYTLPSNASDYIAQNVFTNSPGRLVGCSPGEKYYYNGLLYTCY